MTVEARHRAEAGNPSGNVLVLPPGFHDPPPARARLWGTTANVVPMSGKHICADVYGATITLA
jgi:hypothetical protein